MASQTMEALVLLEPHKYEFQQVPVPRIGPQEVLCRVGAVAICGTDLGIIAGNFFPMWPPHWPFIIGHEWAGTIEAVGPGVTDFAPGDKVAGSSAVGCGYCANCMKGRYNLCLNYGNMEAGHRQYGMSAPGAYAEYMNAHTRSIAKLAPDEDLGEASLLDTAGIALHIAKQGKIAPGDTVAVIGPGAVGSITYQCARALGAGRVIVIGRGDRLRIAEKLGYETVDFEKTDVLAYMKETTGGIGPDVVLECAGSGAAIRQGIDMIKKGGRVVIGGVAQEEVPIPAARILLDELEIVGSRAAPNCLPQVMALWRSGALNLADLVSHRFPLRRFTEAMETFRDRKDGALKVVVEP